MNARRLRRWGAALAVAIALPAGLLGLRFGYEHAAYEVVHAHETFEVRRYEPRIVAEVAVEGSNARDASSRGFRILADYIFGNNTASQSIAMTAPVERQPSETVSMTTPVDARSADGNWTVWFTMPSKYSIHELPRPNDPRVTLREVPSARVVAVKFSGVATPEDFERQRETLERDARRVGLTLSAGAPSTFSQYDPPWTPGLLRRNEVLLELVN
jgi:hypothetical protein